MTTTAPTALTDQYIKSLKPGPDRIEIRDAKTDGLSIRVEPTGKKTFVIRYSLEGRQRRKSLGGYPALSLAEARSLAREIRLSLDRHGEAPDHGIFSDGKSAGVLTVNKGWQLYHAFKSARIKTAPENARMYRRDIAPVIGETRIDRVSVDQLRAIVADKFKTAKYASNRLHALLSAFFRWCVREGYSETHLSYNPMQHVPKLHKEEPRSRFLSEQELKWWFASLPEACAYAPIHELMMRTLCRESEILNLTWGMLGKNANGDPILSIPITKNGDPHIVWLHPSALRLLPQRPGCAKDSDRIWPVSTWSSKSVERIRAAMNELASEAGLSIDQWQPHDYRRTGRSYLEGLLDEHDNALVMGAALEKLLAHKDNSIRGVYNVWSYYKEKKQALHRWNDHLDELINLVRSQ